MRIPSFRFSSPGPPLTTKNTDFSLCPGISIDGKPGARFMRNGNDLHIMRLTKFHKELDDQTAEDTKEMADADHALS